MDDQLMEAVLAAKVDDETVRDYLYNLLSKLWGDPNGFSGKRPFGDSGWYLDLYYALARASLISATFDDDGSIEYIPDDEQDKADVLISNAIHYLCHGKLKE